MDAELKQLLARMLASPQSYSVDGESISQRSASDLLALLRKLQGEEAAKDGALKRCGFFKVSTQQAGR